MLTFSTAPPLKDLQYIGWFMREADARELFASNGEQPVVTVLESWGRSSAPYLFYWNGVPVFVTGCVPIPDSEIGIPWMVATDVWDNDIPKKTLWKLSTHFIKRWLTEHTYLMNYLDCRNSVAREWLHRLGATEAAIEKHGYLDLPFIRFEIH